MEWHQRQQSQWPHGEWPALPHHQQPSYEQPAGQAFVMSAPPRLPQARVPQLAASGSGSGQMTSLAQHGQQHEAFGSPSSPGRAASLGSLPSLGSLALLQSPLLAAAVPAADVPWQLDVFAPSGAPPAPPRQPQQQQRTSQPPSQDSCAASRQLQLPGAPPARDGDSSQRPPRQPAGAPSLEVKQRGGPRKPEQMQQMLCLARELGLLPPSEPGSPAGPQPSWGPLLKGCTPPLPGHQRQPAGSELLRQLSGQLDLPLVDPPARQEGPPAMGTPLEPTVLQPALHNPAAPLVQLRPVGGAAHQQPYQVSPAAGAGTAAGGAPVLRTPAGVPPVQRVAPQQPQQAQQAEQRKAKKSSKSKQEQKRKQPQLQQQLKKKPKQAAAKRQQVSPQAGQKPAAASTHAKQASMSGAQQLLLQAGMEGLTAALFGELRRQQQERQAAEAAALHREQRAILEKAQAEQRRQLELAQQAQLLQLERSHLLWKAKRAAEQQAAAASLPSQLAASPQRQSSQAERQASAAQLERQPSAAQLERQMSAAQAVLGPRTLSAQLEQEERWARQRAQQEMWARAATCLVARSGSLEPGRLPGSAQG